MPSAPRGGSTKAMVDSPDQPSTAYLDATTRAIHDRMSRTGWAKAQYSDTYEGQEILWKEVEVGVDKRAPLLRDLALDLHAHPELAFREVRSAAAVADVLEQQGYQVERGVHEVSTALRAEFATAGFDPALHPTIAVMSEYDALPGIGHACGHNLIAASGVGAFLAAADALNGSGHDAKLVFLGTPAEEGHSGKEYMIRGGMLDGIDVAVMMHPFSFDISSHVWVGRRTLDVTFTGIAAHASSQPFMGRNALDAATLAYQGMGLLRQQMPPSDRLHAVIAEGGNRPSVIPEQARLVVYVRSLMTDTIVDLSARIDDILDGAALMAGVSVERTWDTHPMSLPIRNNQVLARRWALTQTGRGRQALPSDIVPDTLAASTDFGNVSHLVPAIHPMVKIAPEGVALHTEAFEHWAGTDDGIQGLIDASIGLAQVIVDVAADPDLRDEARAEFEAAGGAVTVSEVLGRV